MDNLFDIITRSYSTISSITLYDKFKTGNPLYDTIIATLLATLSGYIINYIRGFLTNYTFVGINLENIYNIFYNVVNEGCSVILFYFFLTYVAIMQTNQRMNL